MAKTNDNPQTTFLDVINVIDRAIVRLSHYFGPPRKNCSSMDSTSR